MDETKMKQQRGKYPLILRFHRLMDAFAKSDDERDFYLDLIEGFIIFVDIEKNLEELELLEQELSLHAERYRQIPKMTFYETKKFMEGFVNEKVYDIDTKEKLLDIIAAKEARENFLEFIYDHLPELEKWQQYYHERFRIRIIEWLRNNRIIFVFEEDLNIPKNTLEKVKHQFLENKATKDVQNARETIATKAKTYYCSEALNPRPRRGRPPKQVAKVEVDPQYTGDIYKTVPAGVHPFLFMPDFTSSVTFSAKYDTEAQLVASLRGGASVKIHAQLEVLSQRLESLRHISACLKAEELDDDGKWSFETVSKKTVALTEGEKGKLSNLVKEVLPKKQRGRPVKKKEEIQEFLQKKQKAGIKQVSQIKKRALKKNPEGQK